MPPVHEVVVSPIDGDTDGAISEQDQIDFNMTVTSSEFDSFLPYYSKQKMPCLRTLQKPNLLSMVHKSSIDINLKKK